MLTEKQINTLQFQNEQLKNLNKQAARDMQAVRAEIRKALDLLSDDYGYSEAVKILEALTHAGK